jgi:hypothetical protein
MLESFVSHVLFTTTINTIKTSLLKLFSWLAKALRLFEQATVKGVWLSRKIMKLIKDRENETKRRVTLCNTKM